VIGAYGSTVLDMETAHFASPGQHGFPDGQICDDCITELLERGDLLRDAPIQPTNNDQELNEWFSSMIPDSITGA